MSATPRTSPFRSWGPEAAANGLRRAPPRDGLAGFRDAAVALVHDPSRAGTLRGWEADVYLGEDGSLATGGPILA